jgi:hypothetical protein
MSAGSGLSFGYKLGQNCWAVAKKTALLYKQLSSPNPNTTPLHSLMLLGAAGCHRCHLPLPLQQLPPLSGLDFPSAVLTAAAALLSLRFCHRHHCLTTDFKARRHLTSVGCLTA